MRNGNSSVFGGYVSVIDYLILLYCITSLTTDYFIVFDSRHHLRLFSRQRIEVIVITLCCTIVAQLKLVSLFNHLQGILIYRKKSRIDSMEHIFIGRKQLTILIIGSDSVFVCYLVYGEGIARQNTKGFRSVTGYGRHFSFVIKQLFVGRYWDYSVNVTNCYTIDHY